MKITDKLQKLMKDRILLIDGGMGTMIQRYNLTADDFGGEKYEGCTDYLVITRPDVIEQIHSEYLKAGADIIETDTFGGSALVLAEYGLYDKAYEINYEAAVIAKKACSAFENRFVAGSMGPTTKSLILMGDEVTFEQMMDGYYHQALGLINGGVDFLFVETIHDTLNLKSALVAIKKAEEELQKFIPIFISASISADGRMLAGQDIDTFYRTVKDYNPFAVGMNCAVGPKDLKRSLITLSELSDKPTFIFPNAGLPNEFGEYNENPHTFSDHINEFIEGNLLNLVGGCCGTTPEHIAELRKIIDGKIPREINNAKYEFAVSGIDPVLQDDKIRPILVGERSNVQGSRAFKKLIRENRFDDALEVTKSQVRNGAQIIDICLEDSEFNEIDAIHNFYPLVAKSIKAPVMIDSTSLEAVETALQYCQGKSIINSLNLESGEERIAKGCSIMKKYSASAVVGLIDEIGMALTLDRKIEVANRLYNLFVNTYKISPQDLIFDMLVFTVDTGNDEKFKGTAKATIDAIREFKKKYPTVMTTLGISNISFGLPPAGRIVLNSVYFYHCVQAGLDLAIVNPTHLKRYNAISEEEIRLSERVIFEQNSEALADFTRYFRNKDPSFDNSPDKMKDMDANESLQYSIMMGIKQNVEKDLKELLTSMKPMDIINNVIMVGMAEVGKLFGEAKMIVTEVLQSAEVVKKSIAILEPLLRQGEMEISKKKIIIATVKGDVHDIGKSLVKIIFESNGYEVLDLGTRVDSRKLIDEVKKYNPDIIGLSGLLVKSCRFMVTTAEDLKNEGILTPIIVGGAALSEKFTDREIKPVAGGDVFYARDAMSGLAIVNQIFEGIQ